MESEITEVLTMATLNPNIISSRYDMTGPIFTRHLELQRELDAGVKKPFSQILVTFYGDCHVTGQKPNTFIRQVLALCAYPELLKSAEFPADAKDRAKQILDSCGGHSIGAYTMSWGLDVVRKGVAEFITRRDNQPCDYNDIVLTSGATSGVRTVMTLLLTGKNGVDRAGFMVSNPQYPMHHSAIAEFGACAIIYHLDENNKWSLNVNELERAIAEAKPYCKPRAIMVINPGNPTGSVLTRENIEEVIKFAHRHKLFLLADEVYQQNVWAEDVQFLSFKKVLVEMDAPYNKMQLASFMSIGKGYMGENGLRGGFVEMINVRPEVKAQYMKAVQLRLCPSVTSQAVLYSIVNPPRPGEPSYDLFIKESTDAMTKLKEKAHFMTEVFNSVEGIFCHEVMGAMYAYPRIHIPEKAIKAAEAKGQTPDMFYCLALLEETGICTLPGSAFNQKPGSGMYHFRMSIIQQMDVLKPALEKFKEFHLNFLAKYK